MLVKRYRTIRECYLLIKSYDNESAVSEWFIRSLCKKKIIEYRESGNKSLVNFDSLLNYLNGVNADEE